MGSGKKKSTSEKQTLILWALLAKEGAAAFQKDLKPEPEKSDRDALERAGLIRSEKKGRSLWLEVTDQGWEWAGNHLSAPLPRNSPAGCEILRAWLTRLEAYLQARHLVLADLLDPRPTAPTAPANGSEQSLPDRVRRAYLDVTNGRLNTRAMLSDIRSRLKEIDRATLDETLKSMQQRRQAALYQLDNRVEITDADRDAAIYFAGEPRHILWIEK